MVMFTIQLHFSVQMTPQHNLFKLLTSHIVEVLQLMFCLRKQRKLHIAYVQFGCHSYKKLISLFV